MNGVKRNHSKYQAMGMSNWQTSKPRVYCDWKYNNTSQWRSHSSWCRHLQRIEIWQAVTRKDSQQFALLKRLINIVLLEIRKNIYQTFIVPHFYYCSDENDVLFSKWHRHTQKKILVLLSGVEPLPLSYRRLVGAKAIKLGSWDKHPAYC